MPRLESQSFGEFPRAPKPSTTRVLIVDDQFRHSELAEIALKAVGYQTRTVQDPLNVLRIVNEWAPDVIILDVRMPRMDGVTLARKLRANACKAGLLFLTSINEADTVDAALDLADQYIVKPFEPFDLVARVRVVMRNLRQSSRAGASGDSRLPQIDPSKCRVSMPDGRTFDLTKREIAILSELIAANGQTVTNAQLRRAIWGDYSDDANSNNNIQAIIRRLRVKLERNADQPELIVTRPKVGYRLALDA